MRHAAWVCVTVCAACHGGGATAHGPAVTVGAVTVLSRDHDSGEVVQNATLELRGPSPARLTSSEYGFATFEHLAPGSYDLVATFAGQPVEIDGIPVRANQTQYLDVAFTLGRPEPITYRYGDARAVAIDRYHPKGADPTRGHIEGVVSDVTTHLRVPGAVVTAAHGTDVDVLQTVTDEQGRYHFDAVLPGTYVVSADYNVAGRGAIEQRRSDIPVAGGEAVIVPIAIELAR